MSKVIFPPSIRRLTRKSGDTFEIKKRPLYGVCLRINAPKKDRTAAENVLYGHLFRLLQTLVGYSLTKGFTLDVLRGGKWHELPHRVRPKVLKDFLIEVDAYCERGWLSVDVDGTRFAKSKRT